MVGTSIISIVATRLSGNGRSIDCAISNEDLIDCADKEISRTTFCDFDTGPNTAPSVMK